MNNLLTNEKDITAWLKEYDVKNYTLVPDSQYGFIVNVEGDLSLSEKKLKSIDVQFGHVNGTFNCSGNELKNLKGAPISLAGDYYCFDNQLVSLLGAPKVALGDFFCYRNNLTSLEHGPESAGVFNCMHNQLTNLIGAPKSVGGHLSVGFNQINTLEGFTCEIRHGFYCQDNNLSDLKNFPTILEYNEVERGSFKSVFLENNPLLENLQDITSYYEVKQILNMYQEKHLLSATVDVNCQKNNIHKI